MLSLKESSSRGKISLTCEFCGRNFLRTPAKIKNHEKRGQRVRFCSKPCRASFMIREGRFGRHKKRRKGVGLASIIGVPPSRW